VLDGLASLLDKSLIQRKEVEWGQARFSMLWTIREYALERLAMSGEGKHIRRQHALYYLSLAEAAEPHLTSTERGLWLQRLEREHDNLRAALSWCQSESGDAVIGLQLAGSLHWFWHFRGHTSEGRQWIESALERSDPSHRTAARAKALFAAARLAVLQCNDTTTLPRLSESVEIYRQLGETRALAHALIFLGIVKVLQGEKSGINCIEESVALFWEVRDDWGLACALDFLGDAEIMIGDLERANNLKEESLSLYRKLHDKGGTASQLGELGRVALQRGDYGAARSRLEEALTIQREVGDRWVIALTIRNLGDVAQLEGDYEKASAFYQESLSHFQELGEKMRMAAVLRSLGHVALHQGDHEHATSLYQESLELGEELGAQGRVILIYSLVGLAGIAAARQELDLAARLLACVEALHRPSSSTMARVDLSEYERNLASVRAQLSTPALVEAWQVGQAMTLEQALLAAQTVTHAPR
jgi:tetratricopeptide (TPR) repeat protein